MGRGQSNTSPPSSPSRPRFPLRTCHRKGCGRTFWPRSCNQRYCRDPECLRLLHRWQAAKRQRERRRQAEKRQQHAEAERARRQRQRDARKEAQRTAPSGSVVAGVRAAPRAWSRSEKKLPDFCDRPGCYDPLPGPRRGPAQYCGSDCAGAQRRVQDRERKFKARQQKAAERRAEEKKQARASKASTTPPTLTAEASRDADEITERSPKRVRTSASPTAEALSSRDPIELLCFFEEVSQDDPKTCSGRRSRAPPSG